jgi:hypothetical protein
MKVTCISVPHKHCFNDKYVNTQPEWIMCAWSDGNMTTSCFNRRCYQHLVLFSLGVVPKFIYFALHYFKNTMPKCVVYPFLCNTVTMVAMTDIWNRWRCSNNYLAPTYIIITIMHHTNDKYNDIWILISNPIDIWCWTVVMTSVHTICTWYAALINLSGQ